MEVFKYHGFPFDVWWVVSDATKDCGCRYIFKMLLQESQRPAADAALMNNFTETKSAINETSRQVDAGTDSGLAVYKDWPNDVGVRATNVFSQVASILIVTSSIIQSRTRGPSTSR